MVLVGPNEEFALSGVVAVLASFPDQLLDLVHAQIIVGEIGRSSQQPVSMAVPEAACDSKVFFATKNKQHKRKE